MKKLAVLIVVTAMGYVGISQAEELRTQSYFREHLEEARSVAKKCNIAQEECKNARRAVWSYDHSSHQEKAATEPVKK